SRQLQTLRRRPAQPQCRSRQHARKPGGTRRSHQTARNERARTPSDPGSYPQSKGRKTTDRPGLLPRPGTAPVPSGCQRRNPRSASESSAPDRSKVGQSWDNTEPVRNRPSLDQEPQRSAEPGDPQGQPHQAEMSRKTAPDRG